MTVPDESTRARSTSGQRRFTHSSRAPSPECARTPTSPTPDDADTWPYTCSARKTRSTDSAPNATTNRSALFSADPQPLQPTPREQLSRPSRRPRRDLSRPPTRRPRAGTRATRPSRPLTGDESLARGVPPSSPTSGHSPRPPASTTVGAQSSTVTPTQSARATPSTSCVTPDHGTEPPAPPTRSPTRPPSPPPHPPRPTSPACEDAHALERVADSA